MALQITASKPRMVLDIPGYFPNAIQLKNGDLLVQTMWADDRRPKPHEYKEFYAFDGPTTEKDWMEFNDRRQQLHGDTYVHVLSSHWGRSTDGGRTFTETGLPPVISYVQEDNGDVLALQWYTHWDAQGNPIIRSWRSHDNCHSWDAPYDIPVISPPFRTDGLLVPHRRILRVEGDTYLLLVYGKLDGDTQFRSMVFRTLDAFRTLHYYATIGTYEPGMEHAGGLTESDMVRTDDGRILCVIRNEGLCPMYQTFSSNNGATWEPLRLFPDAGVDPALCRLDNGVVVCSYGRPGVKVAFSETGGINWQKRLTLLQRQIEVNGTEGIGTLPDPVHQRSCCYTEVVQTAPNVATVFYSAPIDWSDDPEKYPWRPAFRKDFRIFAVDLTVERT